MLISLLILPLLVQSIALNRQTKERIILRCLEVFYCKVVERNPALLTKIKWSRKRSCWLGKKKEEERVTLNFMKRIQTDRRDFVY